MNLPSPVLVVRNGYPLIVTQKGEQLALFSNNPETQQDFRCSLVVDFAGSKIRSFTTLNRCHFFQDDPFLSSLARPNEVLILRTGPCGDACQNEIPNSMEMSSATFTGKRLVEMVFWSNLHIR